MSWLHARASVVPAMHMTAGQQASHVDAWQHIVFLSMLLLSDRQTYAEASLVRKTASGCSGSIFGTSMHSLLFPTSLPYSCKQCLTSQLARQPVAMAQLH